MKMKNRIVALLLCLVMLLCMLPVGVMADEADGEHTSHDGWTEWTDTGALPSESGKYVLMNDINVAGPVGLGTEGAGQTDGKEITLCLNGKTVTQCGTGDYERFYRINANSVVTICDCTAHVDADGKYVAGVLTGGKNGAFLFDGGSAATLNLYDGIITGNSAAAGGAMVIQGTSFFNMFGGEISGNEAVNGNGGAIYCANSATLNLLGGTISGNKASKPESVGRGGAIFTSAGSCTLQGVTITGNSADHGGGVFINNGNVYMEEGTVVSENNAVVDGGGIRLVNGGDTAIPKLYVNGGEIINNTSDIGGGLYVGTGGTIKLLGGVVKGNTATSGGGAMRAAGASVVTLGSATITENVGGTTGGIHYAKGTMMFDGAPVITGNTLADGTVSNFLYEAQEGSSMNLKGLTAGAQIGVTLFEGVTAITATGATDEIAACFTSDNVADKVWLATETGLELGDAPEPTEPPTTEAPTTEATEPAPTDPEPVEPEGGSAIIWIVLAVAVVVIVVVVVVVLKKKKK